VAVLKFGRNYSLSIQVPEESSPLIITPPLSLEFDINRNDLASASTASLRVYNLAQKKRDLVRRSPVDFDRIIEVELRAGYGNTNLPIIFRGQVSEAWSVREGVNFITQLELFDGGRAYIQAVIDMSFSGGTPFNDIINKIVDNVVGQTPGLTKGKISNFSGTLPVNRGNTYSGPGLEVLKDLTGDGMFIDNGTINCLTPGDFLPVQIIPVINSASGLLGTPRLEFPKVIVNVLFSPNLAVGQNVKLETDSSKFAGFYQIIAISHRGMISPAVAGEAVTTLGLVSGQFLEGIPA